MLLIPCPHCGERDQSEFHYGGRSTRSPDPGNTSETIQEIWYHQAGCESWIEICRNPNNHEIES
ncbi:MAG: sarcosine oxidase subunit delta [Gammaproteobacteria bacterium]|nr:sarcosine oxidase subunit delta [Gammaproteobacteria bacterium]